MTQKNVQLTFEGLLYAVSGVIAYSKKLQANSASTENNFIESILSIELREEH